MRISIGSFFYVKKVNVRASKNAKKQSAGCRLGFVVGDIKAVAILLYFRSMK